ncbi:RICIN domain-containing protein [Actinoplanes sp. NPDC051861]|uniref:RICIN domain-containing protein n=1 Tax=Actinoplanes sp. NPDC051861 TaxID=3155170 RepID=UPI003418DDEE
MKVRRLRLSRPVLLGSALALIVLLGAGAFMAGRAADAAEPVRADRFSASDVRILASAAESCPALTPARLAGQVMATPAGAPLLTPQQFRENVPWDGAQQGDREAAVTALAHLMCRFAGQARTVGIGEDPWRVALAAHRLGPDQVIKSGAVPGDAKEYVDTVERYAAWYALQPEFGGGVAAPSPTAGYPAVTTAIPVPDAYVGEVVAAGRVCAEMPPALVAAQIMATSGFDAGKLGPAGEQGIAQFLPQVWTANVKAAASRTPWQPEVAIPALGRTMCKLIKRSGGQYAAALAAFTRGSATAAVTALAETITKAQAEYAKDTRLGVVKAPAPATSKPPKPGSAAPTTPAPAPTDQPAIKAADASGGDYGPYFIVNLATEMCVDLPGTGPGPRDGPVTQFTCVKSGDDNQEWTFEPRAVDGQGNQLYWIRNADDGFCIDPPGVEGVASGTALNETGCFDDDNQYFRLESKRSAGGLVYYWLRNTVTDMCVDVPGAGDGGPDVQLTVVPCLANDDHDWALVERSKW